MLNLTFIIMIIGPFPDKPFLAQIYVKTFLPKVLVREKY